MLIERENKTEILRGLADHARVWIYQSSRPFSEKEVLVLQSQINGFANDWAAHKKELVAAGQVLYNRFIVLAVDEALNKASGCSIDASVYFIKSIENQYDTQLFDRMTFAYLEDETVKTVGSTDFARLYTEGAISDETLVFDNLVKSVSELKTIWLKPLKTSWHKRFI